MAIVNINEDNKLYTGTGSADTIYSSDYIRHKNVTITGGSGNDTFGRLDKSIRFYNSKVTGNEGSDVMYINAVSSSVNGGAGDDTIRIGANYSTIDGSAGNDIIHLGGKGNNIINYTTGDGNDTIYSYKTGDKILLGSSKTKVTKAALDGSDYVLTIGKGNITIKDIGSDTSIAVVDYSGNETTYTDTVKTAAFTERYFTELPADTWFTSVESFAEALEIDSLIEKFKEGVAVDLSTVDTYEVEDNLAEKILTLNKN